MDIFGTALLAHYRGRSEAPLRLVRDDGWEDTHSPGLYFRADPLEFEAPPLMLIDGPTLDVGCGAGRHLRWLGAAGHRSCGLDASPGAVSVCRQQGLAPVGLCDVMSDRTVDLPFRPESICLFGNNIGIGGTFDGSLRLLSRLHGMCADKGRLLLTGIDLRATENPRHIAYQDSNAAAGRRRGEMRLTMSYDGETGSEFRWYHPEPDEIEELAGLSDWKLDRLERVGGFFWASLRIA